MQYHRTHVIYMIAIQTRLITYMDHPPTIYSDNLCITSTLTRK